MTIPGLLAAKTADRGGDISVEDVRKIVTSSCPTADYADKRILLIIPDATRTAPVGTYSSA